MASDSEGLPLLTYAGMVWRRQVLVIAIALGLAAPAFVVSFLQPPLYQAKAQILLVQQQVDESFNVRVSDLNDRQVGIQVALLMSDDVAEVAAREGAASRIYAQNSTGSNVITMTATEPDAAQVAKTLDAYITAFKDSRVQQSQRAIDAASSQLQQRLNQLNDQINQTPENAATERQAREEQRTNLQGQLGQLQAQRGLVEAGITVVAKPAVPKAPVSPRPARDGALGLVIGLVLGISLAVLLETLRRRRTLSSPNDAPRRDPGTGAPGTAPAPSIMLPPPVVSATSGVNRGEHKPVDEVPARTGLMQSTPASEARGVSGGSTRPSPHGRQSEVAAPEASRPSPGGGPRRPTLRPGPLNGRQSPP